MPYANAHPTQTSNCPRTTTTAIQCTLQEALLLAHPGDRVARAPRSNGGGTIVYDVYQGTAPGHEYYQYPVNFGSPIPHQVRTYVVAGLLNGVTSYFTVRAKNSSGFSPPSNEVAVTPHR